jgi:hypothetical protein
MSAKPCYRQLTAESNLSDLPTNQLSGVLPVQDHLNTKLVFDLARLQPAGDAAFTPRPQRGHPHHVWHRDVRSARRMSVRNLYRQTRAGSREMLRVVIHALRQAVEAAAETPPPSPHSAPRASHSFPPGITFLRRPRRGAHHAFAKAFRQSRQSQNDLSSGRNRISRPILMDRSHGPNPAVLPEVAMNTPSHRWIPVAVAALSLLTGCFGSGVVGTINFSPPPGNSAAGVSLLRRAEAIFSSLDA